MNDLLEFPIFVKPPQSGKTNDAILEPMIRSIKSGRIPVVIIPSRIQLQKQLTSRIVEKVSKVCDIDENSVGRFDTGNKFGKLYSSSDAVRGISGGRLKSFIVLNNIQGMTKLICTILKSDRKFDIIVDEIHGFFNVGRVEHQKVLDDVKCGFWDVYSKYRENIEHKHLKLDNVGIMYILFHLIKENGHSISGTTATVSFVAQSKVLKLLDLSPNIVKLEIPDCYKGYESINKKSYEGTYKNAIESIIQNNPEGTVTMCHVGNTQESHYDAANDWIDFCLLYNVPRCSILSIVDNSDGYTLYNWEKIVKNYDKSKTSEPWKLIDFYRNKCGYSHIGIFGDRCMSESNTYQKCSDDINCPINDLIVIPFQHTINNMTIMIQKIGRIFGNDTIGDNSRTIWFPLSEDTKTFQDKIEDGLKLDDKLQDSVKLRNVDYRKIVRQVTKQESQCITNRGKYQDLEDRFRKYRTSTTKIARFVRGISGGIFYTKEQMLSLLTDSGYKNPEQMLHSFCKDDGFSLYILQKNDDSMFSLLPEVEKYHHLCLP